MTSKKMKDTNKKKVSSQTSKEKPERKVKTRNISGRKKQAKGLEELVRTWDEDLCE